MNVTTALACKPMLAAYPTYWVSSELFSFPPVGVRWSQGQFRIMMLKNGRGDTGEAGKGSLLYAAESL